MVVKDLLTIGAIWYEKGAKQWNYANVEAHRFCLYTVQYVAYTEFTFIRRS